MVYVVMEICDYEYGCYGVNSVWDSYDAADNHIQCSLGGNELVKFYDGHTQYKYLIKPYEVRS